MANAPSPIAPPRAPTGAAPKKRRLSARGILVLIALFVVGWVFAFQAMSRSFAESEARRFRGTVVRADDGTAIQQAVLRFDHDGFPYEAGTYGTPGGTFLVEHRKGRSTPKATVSVAAPGFVVLHAEITFDPANRDLGAFRLVPLTGVVPRSVTRRVGAGIHDTGLDVVGGEVVVISAAGAVTITEGDREGMVRLRGDGRPAGASAPAPWEPRGALLFRIGQGAWGTAGERVVHLARTSGRLSLCVNVGAAAHVSGGCDVEIATRITPP